MTENLRNLLKHTLLLFQHFKNSNQPCQFYQLLHAAEFCNSDQLIHVVRSALMVMLCEAIKWYYRQHVQDKPAEDVVARDIVQSINYLKVIIVKSSKKYYEYVYCEE